MLTDKRQVIPMPTTVATLGITPVSAGLGAVEVAIIARIARISTTRIQIKRIRPNQAHYRTTLQQL